jgi:hypothetical protein
MVDLHSVAASSHPSRRERESEQETTFRSRAGRSQRSRGRTDTTTVMLESQPQPTAGTTTSPPAAVGLDAALLAARQLLNNPPPIGVSPSAAEQWHHDVDQLIVTTINTPHREGRRQPSMQQSRFLLATSCAIHGTGAPGVARCTPAGVAPRADGQLAHNGPQGGNQPLSRWGKQSHHHRVQPREVSRYRWSQPRERL